jgi:putative copper export protein
LRRRSFAQRRFGRDPRPIERSLSTIPPVYDLLVVVHVVSAAVWVGGVVALTFVAVPVAQRQTGSLRGELLHDFGRRWRPIGWGAFALAVATGMPVANRWNAFDHQVLFDTRFGRLLLLKAGLVALLIALSVAHHRLGGVLARQIREGRDQAARRPLVLIGRASLATTLAIPVVAVLLAR